jgi:hypothetical protein
MRREIERAIDEAVNPKSMSTHSGMARINAATLQRLLAIADATETLPRPAKREPATNKEIDAEWLKIKPVLYPMYGLGDFRDGFRAAERFHGIKEDKT